jgi:uncharacterized protein YcgI (DUF1989 family)
MSDSVQLEDDVRIAKQTGTAFELERGRTLRVIDPEGEQVADLIAFAADNKDEWLSSGRSIDYAGTIYLTTGHVLYSNRSNQMLTVVDDTVGRHDFLLTPCSQEMFHILYNQQGHHPSCFENLVAGLEEFDIPSDAIPTTFNIFMNVIVRASGTVEVMAPLSRPGDYIELKARTDLIVGLTACSSEKSNAGRCKPIDYEII